MGVTVKVVGFDVGRVESVRRLKGGMTVVSNEVCQHELWLQTANKSTGDEKPSV